MRRTAHVHVHAVEASHGGQLFRRTRHQIRLFAENLHKQLALAVPAFNQGNGRRMIARRVEVAHRADHLRRRHIAALLKAQNAKRPVCNACHRGKADARHALSPREKRNAHRRIRIRRQRQRTNVARQFRQHRHINWGIVSFFHAIGANGAVTPLSVTLPLPHSAYAQSPSAESANTCGPRVRYVA